MNIKKLLITACLLMSTNVMALCPDGTSFDQNLGFCANGVDAFGPFTNDMVDDCISAGGGSACTNTYQYNVQGTTIDVLRWSESFTNNLRGDNDCPTGTVRSSTYGGHCFENVNNGSNNVYGNFSQTEVDACNRLNGGTACYTNRWGSSFYLSVKAEIANPSAAAVPYYNQLNNYYDPYGTCSVTSLAMITDMSGFTNPSVTGRSPDYLYEELGGVLQTVPSLANGYNTMAIRAGSSKRANSKTNGTFAELQQALASGKVAIVHGWFTNPGHIMVVTSYDGTHYTVNDPFGKWNQQKWGSYNSYVSGEGQKYAKAAFEYAINDNGQGNDLWLHIFDK
ncbi:C39 family peptidase [Psychrosphaera aquimarina]|uniref:C39 family peptidase n=1 Tax=Psychrosphaera aquimarina TaxID=2044854 RepID=A0ABU3R175_9GAMM|nr:C39 family peptidase [Psychrosphaera aquimarina]MDU0113232.1 C39 family peptidase [Psychrosphaera aquimarina]